MDDELRQISRSTLNYSLSFMMRFLLFLFPAHHVEVARRKDKGKTESHGVCYEDTTKLTEAVESYSFCLEAECEIDLIRRNVYDQWNPLMCNCWKLETLQTF